MFSGIVAAIGKVKIIKKVGIWTVSIIVEKILIEGFISKHNPIKIGASILCSGICLTVKQIKGNLITFDISEETASKTNFLSWKVGTMINLEKSLRVGEEIGGHFVSGHVDKTVEVIKINESEGSRLIRIKINHELKKHIVYKGSITLNGVSLTVNEVGQDFFEVNIIPFTWDNTNFNILKTGSILNLEVDLLSRYLLNSIKNN